MAGNTVKFVVSGEISQGRLAFLRQAGAADDIGEHRVGGVLLHLAVHSSIWDVVGVMNQQDQVVAAVKVQGGDRLVIERLPDGAALQLGVPERRQQPVLLAAHLSGGKYNIDQVSPQHAGEGFFQESQIEFRLLLRHDSKG